MAKIELSKVFFGAVLTFRSSKAEGDPIGREGILVLYQYLDAEDECLPAFYYDLGWGVGYISHSHSRYKIEDGVFKATSIYSGSEKEYDVSAAVEMGPEIMQLGNPASRTVPDEWRELFANVYPQHCWNDSPVLDTKPRR